MTKMTMSTVRPKLRHRRTKAPFRRAKARSMSSVLRQVSRGLACVTARARGIGPWERVAEIVLGAKLLKVEVCPLALCAVATAECLTSRIFGG